MPMSDNTGTVCSSATANRSGNGEYLSVAGTGDIFSAPMTPYSSTLPCSSATCAMCESSRIA